MSDTVTIIVSEPTPVTPLPDISLRPTPLTFSGSSSDSSLARVPLQTSRLLGTRLGLPTRSSIIRSTTSLSTSLSTSSNTVETTIGGSSTSTTALTPSPPANSAPAAPNKDDSSLLHNSNVETETSEYARTAVIISAVTLLLVLVAIAALGWFLCRRKTERKKKRKDKLMDSRSMFNQDESQEDTIRQRDVEEGRTQTTAPGGQAFDPMNMVAIPVRNITSMTESQIGSLTTITNPPPPYGNNQSRSDLTSPRTPVRDSSFGFGPSIITPTTNTTSSGPLLQVPIGGSPEGVGGRQSYSLDTVVRSLPSSLTARYAYKPAKADELRVYKGDKVHIKGVFDDGWCLCRMENGGKGIIPLAVLDFPREMQMGQTQLENQPSPPTSRLEQSTRAESRNMVGDPTLEGGLSAAPLRLTNGGSPNGAGDAPS